jgi:hypothetical protein
LSLSAYTSQAEPANVTKPAEVRQVFCFIPPWMQMANAIARSANLKQNIPTYLPLADAAKKFGMSIKVLTQMIRAGKIEAVQLPSGEVLVAAENNGQEWKTKKDIISEKFAHLRGKTITPYKAQKKYGGIHRNNFINWARSGYIEIRKEEDRLMELDEADVAYCAYVYGEKKKEYGGSLAGVTIFDEKGNPYQLKYKEVAEQMRAERRRTK